uniref:Uncharacterized protein n=1 Tax=Euplotes harpa TaxID=151035 RepID=A0A7S3JDM4_9SPIT|mmetsp:Transcript_34116/g.39354  ORF Transcript_34116/g.39354 Transcript_34116/m.39354 type:complete len:312 (+) Transcript_34116:392-1327(+)
MADRQNLANKAEEDAERRLIAEASLSALQIELREAIDRIAKMEKKERRRLEKKNRLRKKRKEQMRNELSRSLVVDETSVKVDNEPRDLESNEKPVMTSKEKLDQLLDPSVKKSRRSAFPSDQRGSVNTEMRQRRLKNRLLTNRGSVAVSSVYSQARTEFSFHPSINQTSMWKPKYDDHHNHKKMWKRMHQENEKIIRKKRLMSEQKLREELAACTFTPELVTKASKQAKNEPLDVKHLSLRLYQYADKFKHNRELMKEKYDFERGEEIRFTPILESSKTNKMLQTVRERKNVYDGLYEDYQKREENKQKLK